MSFSVGIVGLPNVGKSTLFKAITKIQVDIAAYPFTTIHPNVGVVAVPDERLEKIAETIKPEKITPTIIEFVDVAGLVKDAHKGEGLGNQFLANIKECDAVIEVIRGFENQNVEHASGEINPEKDVGAVEIELLMKDLEQLDKALAKLEKEVKSKDKKAVKEAALLKKIKDWVLQGELIGKAELADEEKKEIKEYRFLTQKPVLYILNTDEKAKTLEPKFKCLSMNLKLEEELSELSPKEKEEFGMKSQLDQLILACYNLLDLITFYTVAGGKETRAWTLKKGKNAAEAAGKVHSDFENKFIRAEVINWNKLIEAGGWKTAREKGLLQTAGRDYPVQDGDVIEFKI